MRILFFVLFGFISMEGWASNVTITGNALFFANEPISAFVLANAISNEKLFQAEAVIANDGKYSLSFTLTKPQLVFLKIELREVGIYMHPNSELIVNFSPIENPDNQRNQLNYAIHYVEIPGNSAPDSLYHQLTVDFAEIHSDMSASSDFKKKYDHFFSEKEQQYHSLLENDSLFRTYFTYFKANAYLLTNIPKSSLLKTYLSKGDLIQYEELEYLKFVNATIVPRVQQIFETHQNEFKSAVQEYKIYESLVDVIQIDSIIPSREMASLGLLYFIWSSASSDLLSNENKKAALNQMANFCPYPYQQNAAVSYQERKNKLNPNTEAPLFELLDQNNQLVSLQSFRGNPVYLGFIHSGSRTCIQDLEVVKSLQKKYKKVVFLFVVTDRGSAIKTNLLPESSNLKFVYLHKKYSVLEDYQIWDVPVYFLLDQYGYFLQSPSKRPNMMYTEFEKMFAKKQKNKSYEIIQD